MINYLDDLSNKFFDDGVNKDLNDILYNDIQLLSKLGVDNDKHRNLIFYLDNFYNDICEEINCNPENKEEVISNAFKYLKETDKIDLNKIRFAIYKAIKNLKKIAYPNIAGVDRTNLKPERDINKWIETLTKLYSCIKNGEDKNIVFDKITKEWSPMEKNDFQAWSRYYVKGDHEKYASINPITGLEEIEINPMVKTPEDIKKPIVKTPEDIKKTLLSRLHSAEKLLYNFVNVWPSDVYNRLHQGLSDLKREIMLMRSASTMIDMFIRTASIWEKIGFEEGAVELRKVAQPPEDITSEIEKALTGHEYDKKEKGPVPSPMDVNAPPVDVNAPPPMDAGMPPGMPPGMEEESSLGPLAGVEEPMPLPEAPPGPPIEEKPKLSENPFAGSTIQDVLKILEPLSKELSDRTFIRKLSKADMILDSLRIASHFPEMAEIINKALELNIYMGTRVDKILSKLKGGIKNDKESSPNIDMGELNKKPEEIAFEVEEEFPPKAPKMPMPEKTEKLPKMPMPEKTEKLPEIPGKAPLAG